MRVLPSGSTALLVELDGLDEVLGLYAALTAEPVEGVVDVVPAARTVLLVTDPAVTGLAAVEQAVRRTTPRSGRRDGGELVELPVVYDGADLADVAAHLGVDPGEVVRRHTGTEWTVAFCGFAPGFGYLTPDGEPWHVPRRESPGGWQLIGRTDVAVFDVDREPAALLRPGVRVRFTEVP
jgi:allophanate hydrolase subunit 1